ncbi:DUF2935 domain-containing protein [Clostridium sp. SYSU_GA19001]|uniref:DUF2935 domain-containing protein n=1 Tax=Clostridium caldaquaticum TaxID=2940653 RepID=UPI002076F7F2|nr:DUF2935 domain-containing protein [Clostridium caldaquaticum]MCM8710087.1 DUF2935 domain-containing protein [Clostridium caldaquaticum]
MLTNEQFVKMSLEFDLFFLRISKEHAIFGIASLPPKDTALSRQLFGVKNKYEELLSRAVSLSFNVLSKEVLASNELVTEMTLPAEASTEFLTGIPINKEITKQQLNMAAAAKTRRDTGLFNEISILNRETISLTNSTIAFLTKLLNNILNCKTFSYIYPTMLHHVIEESKFAVMLLNKFQNKDSIDSINEIIEHEIFWNHIMGEHTKFIRGYLDPSEKVLFETANTFSKEFDNLLDKTISLKNEPQTLSEITKESIKSVTELRDFKKQGTEGILTCKVKSIIPPLLSDHVLREANHFLRMLKTFSTMQ